MMSVMLKWLQWVSEWPDEVMFIHSYYGRRVSSKGWSLFSWSIYGMDTTMPTRALASSCLGISGGCWASNVDPDSAEHVDGSHPVENS